ncbi:MAG TPA: hemolysin family protein [Candidatus Thermoplasmatota archaeon]|nr:hemolysin family protein [Candidatus Thermoplasmatota archaeon]
MVLDFLPPAVRIAVAVGLLVALVLASALLSGTEAALLSFPRTRRHGERPEPDAPRGRVEKLLEHPQRILLTVSVSTALLDVAAAALATLLALDAFPGRTGTVVALVVGVGTFLLLTFGRVLPRAVGAHRAETWSLLAARPFAAIAWILAPVVGLYSVLTAAVLRVAGEGEAQAGAYANEEELKTLITIGAEEGILEGGEEEMIHSVLEFGDTTVKEIMVPRVDMVAVPADATLDHLRGFVKDAGFSRLPVYQGNLDNVVGLVLVKELLMKLVEGSGATQVRDIMKEPLFVPETKKLDDLLAEMRQQRTHMVFCVDEFGGVSGLITLEDLIEEIVGEIFDEDDMRHESIRNVDENTALVDARMHVEEVNAACGTAFPEDGPYDTIGGFVLHRLGRVGKEGEAVREGTHEIVVDRVVNRRIVRVRVVKSAAKPKAASPPDAPRKGGEVAG